MSKKVLVMIAITTIEWDGCWGQYSSTQKPNLLFLILLSPNLPSRIFLKTPRILEKSHNFACNPFFKIPQKDWEKMMAASLAVPTANPSFLHIQSPKAILSHNLSQLPKSSSSQSQFFGLKLSYSPSFSVPSSSFNKSTIVAKVHFFFAFVWIMYWFIFSDWLMIKFNRFSVSLLYFVKGE